MIDAQHGRRRVELSTESAAAHTLSVAVRPKPRLLLVMQLVWAANQLPGSPAPALRSARRERRSGRRACCATAYRAIGVAPRPFTLPSGFQPTPTVRGSIEAFTIGEIVSNIEPDRDSRHRRLFERLRTLDGAPGHRR